MTTLEIILVMTLCIETGICVLVIRGLCESIVAYRGLVDEYKKFVDASIDDLCDSGKLRKELHSRNGQP